MLLLDQQENKYPYTLEEIKKTCGIDSIHTARKYLHEVLPPGYEKQGHGMGARYSENTLNSFRLVMKIKKSRDSKEDLKKALKLGQIRSVLEELGQEQINRMVQDDEPVDIHFVVEGENGLIELPKDLKSAFAEQRAILVTDQAAKTIDKVGEGETPYPIREEVVCTPEYHDWKTYPVGESIEVRYKGELSDEQIEELKVVSRILKSIVER